MNSIPALIGCGGQLNQSEWGTEGMEGTEGAEDAEGMETFLRGWWGKNQGFMLISDLCSSTVIGCGGEFNQSEFRNEGHGRHGGHGGHRGRHIE